MKKRILSILFISAFSFHLYAQWNPDAENLLKIGRMDSLYSETLGETRHYWVHLPNNYDYTEDRDYPVVFILDGSLHLTSYVNYEIYHIGELPEMIVVGISNRQNRTRDLTPTNIDGESTTPAWVSGSGGGEDFSSFLVDELIPHIEKQFPTSSYRTLIGHSFGGLFAVNMMINHPGHFKNYIAMDPSLWWDNELPLSQLKEMDTKALSETKLFISIANNTADMSVDMSLEDIKNDTTSFTESMRANINFIETFESLEKNNIAWKYYNREHHASVPLFSMIDGMDYLFDWYAYDGADLDLIRNPNSDAVKTIEAIKRHYEVLSENFGYTMLPEEDMINNAGYMFLDAAPAKAYQFFKLNIENYPESANVYDSMADYYLAQKDVDSAITNLEKAFEVSGNVQYTERIRALKKRED